MNVLLCSSDNNSASGAFLCLVELCKYLQQKEDINVWVILPESGTGTKILNKYNIPYHIIRSYPWVTPVDGNILKKVKCIIKWLFNKRAEFLVKRIVRKYNINLVHSNSTWTYIGIAVAQSCHIKCIWHLREIMQLSQNLKIFYKKEYVIHLFNHTDVVIAVSDYVKQYFNTPRYGILNRIYDGVDEKQFCTEERKILNSNPIRILMINAIYPGKRQHELLQALLKIDDDILTNVMIYIIGDMEIDSEYTKSIYKLANKPTLKEKVVFTGVKENLREIYKKGDISIVCSPYEAFGRVTIESMMSGCLVIGCDSGATAELISDHKTGLLYESGDYETLAATLVKCIQNKEMSRTIASDGQKYALQNFTSDKTGKYIYELYKTLN